MQKIFSLSTMILVILLFSGKALGKITIAGSKGEVKAIVIGFNPTQSEKTGAEELQYYLEKITGEKLPIRPMTDDTPPVSIFVGRSKVAENAGIKTTGLKPEGFIMKTIPQGLVLLGDDAPGDPFDQRVRAGSLFAVYDFLEKFCQVRWLWPGIYGEVIPHQQNLTIPQIDIKEEPAFIIRSINFGSRLCKNPKLIAADWRKWLRRQKMGWVPQMWFGHSVGTHFPPKEYFPTHPEYYALVGGVRKPQQLCTSNKEMQKALVEKIVHAKADVVSISPADGSGFCECEKCTLLWIFPACAGKKIPDFQIYRRGYLPLLTR